MKNAAVDVEASSDDAGFFDGLPDLASAAETFDLARYRAAPDTWSLVVTDVAGSSKAIAAGRHKQVNIVAAAAIAALKNLCAPVGIPVLFGGDGAVVMVPRRHAQEAGHILARLRGFAAREFGLTLRVGLIGMAELRRQGADVLVGRYQPSPGNNFGVFAGGGVRLLEAALKDKQRGMLQQLAAVPETLDDGGAVDMSGLSCRWNALESTRGQMMTLIIQDAKEPHEVHAEIVRLASREGDPRPARLETLKTSWLPKGLLVEARVDRGRGSLALAATRVLGRALLGNLMLARGRPVGRFDPLRYRSEVATNTDFCKHDSTLSLVLDCSSGAVGAIGRFLDIQAGRGSLRYGMHLSPTALMTCLVTSAAENLHMHFIDGGDGGYTSASKRLKGPSKQACMAPGETPAAPPNAP